MVQLNRVTFLSSLWMGQGFRKPVKDCPHLAGVTPLALLSWGLKMSASYFQRLCLCTPDFLWRSRIQIYIHTYLTRRGQPEQNSRDRTGRTCYRNWKGKGQDCQNTKASKGEIIWQAEEGLAVEDCQNRIAITELREKGCQDRIVSTSLQEGLPGQGCKINSQGKSTRRRHPGLDRH